MFSATGPINSFNTTPFVPPVPGTTTTQASPGIGNNMHLVYSEATGTFFTGSETGGGNSREFNPDGSIVKTPQYAGLSGAKNRMEFAIYDDNRESIFYTNRAENSVFEYDVIGDGTTEVSAGGLAGTLGPPVFLPNGTFYGEPYGSTNGQGALLVEKNSGGTGDNMLYYNIDTGGFTSIGNPGTTASTGCTVYNPVSNRVFHASAGTLYRWDGGTTWTTTDTAPPLANFTEVPMIVHPTSGDMYVLLTATAVELWKFNSSGVSSGSPLFSVSPGPFRYQQGFVYNSWWDLIFFSVVYDNTNFQIYFFDPDVESLQTMPLITQSSAGQQNSTSFAWRTDKLDYAIYSYQGSTFRKHT